jgi:hypothetical protein
MFKSKDVDPLSEAEHAQSKMLKFLHRSSLDPILYAGLAQCGRDYCGRLGCSDVCRFRAARQQKKQIHQFHSLLTKEKAPLNEVIFTRTYGNASLQDCRPIDTAPMKATTRRALDKLYNNKVFAVGVVKLVEDGGGWRFRVHLIVSGGEKHELRIVFSFGQRHDLSDVQVTSIENLTAAISEIISYNPLASFWDKDLADKDKEVCELLIKCKPDERLITYGCDKYFRRKILKAKTRPLPKIKKKRPYPYHLQRFMFGGDYWRDRSPYDTNYEAKSHRSQGSTVETPTDYFDDLDD